MTKKGRRVVWSSDGVQQAEYIPVHVSGWTLHGDSTIEVHGKWLFDFLRTDLSHLKSGQLRVLRTDLFAFARPEILKDHDWRNSRLPPQSSLSALQQQARKGIESVWKGYGYHLSGGIGYGITRMEGRIVRYARTGRFVDMFHAAVMDVLYSCWEQIKKCPVCEDFFLKVGKQKYCSPSCSRRANWTQFIASNPRSRDHHAEYVRRVQKKVGSKTKVTIKRRRRS